MKCTMWINLRRQALGRHSRRDSAIYKLSLKEYLQNIVEGIFILFTISYLFYERISVVFLLSPILYFYVKGKNKQMREKHKQELKLQFRDLCLSISSGMSAGSSLANAVSSSYGEMADIYGENSLISKELLIIIKGLRMSVPIERLFEQFAKRSGIEDIRTFSEILSIAQNGGGDFIKIMKTTADGIGEKVDVEREIQSILNSKRFEFMIMDVVPFFIIFYMKMTSPGSMDIMYSTDYGVIIMTLCLLIYCGAYLLGKKVMKIDA